MGPKVLVVHRYYWPDTPPYASILRSIVKRWVDDGAQLDVLSSLPSYKGDKDFGLNKLEYLDGAKVYRYMLRHESKKPLVRIFNTLKLMFLILFHGLRERYDVVMVSTSPPVLVGFSAAIVSRISGAKFIYHCMDLHPEIGRLSGEFSNPIVYRFLMRLERYTCKQASRIVVLSQDMKDSITARQSSLDSKIEVINNFSVPALEQGSPVDSWFTNDSHKVRLLFAGNIGRYQGLEELVKEFCQAKKQGASRLEMIFMGDGTALKSLKSAVDEFGGCDDVHFIPHQSVATAKKSMQHTSIGIVSLQRDVIRYAFPSKTVTYFEQGCPVLCLVERDSELAKIVTENKLGLVADPAEDDSIKKALWELNSGSLEIKKWTENVMRFYERHLETAACLGRWQNLLESVMLEKLK